MPLDQKGIHQYTETDTAPTFSELLNLGMESVSKQVAYIADTSARRTAWTPAPEGVVYQDTDGAKKRYIGVAGLWAEYPPGAKLVANTPISGSVPAWPMLKVAAGSNVLTFDGSGNASIVLPAGTFTASLVTFVAMNGDAYASGNVVHARGGSSLGTLLLAARTAAGGAASGAMRVNWIALGV